MDYNILMTADIYLMETDLGGHMDSLNFLGGGGGGWIFQ